MDNKLIDTLLSGLFDIPREERSQDDVHALLLFVAEAAGIQLDAATSMQLEHLKLTAAVRHLVAEVDAASYRVCLVNQTDSQPHLICSITFEQREDGEHPYVFTSAGSAEEALTKLRQRITAKLAEIQAATSQPTQQAAA